MTPTHKPEDGDRAPISNGGADNANGTAARRDALLQAAIDFVGTLTGMEPPPIEVAPPEVFAPFHAFVTKVEDIVSRPVASSWCARCGCGNDAAGFAHAPLCPRTDATALLAEKAQRIERLEAALRALMEGSRFEAGHWGSIRMPSDAAMELARAALSQPHPHGG